MHRIVFGLLALGLCHCTSASTPSGSSSQPADSKGGDSTRNDGAGSTGEPGAGGGPSAEPGPGSGPGGPGEKSNVISTKLTINTTASAIDGAEGSTSLVLAKPALFAAGQTIVVQQANGAGAGQWERASIESIEGATATLKAPLAHTYRTDPSGATTVTTDHAQAIVVQDYPSLTIAVGGSLTAPSFDGITGGILAIQVAGDLAIQTTGGIVMDGTGYRGGVSSTTQHSNIPAYKAGGHSYNYIPRQAGCPWAPCVPEPFRYLGAGAGGVLHRPGLGTPGTGGGGGGHGTPGGGAARRGGDPEGIGGGGVTYGTEDLSTIFFGAGGGAGGYAADPAQARGGSGGGIVIVFAGKITLDAPGAIRTNGGDGTAQNEHGGGGGGAGGSVLLVTANGPDEASLGTSVAANGGAGGAGVFAGGEGGQGRVHLQAP